MILTEDEARTKWCAEARVAIPMANGNASDEHRWFGVAGANRIGLSPLVTGQPDGVTRENPESARCLGSGCMQWRWMAHLAPHVAHAPGDRGYCGIGGKP